MHTETLDLEFNYIAPPSPTESASKPLPTRALVITNVPSCGNWALVGNSALRAQP